MLDIPSGLTALLARLSGKVACQGPARAQLHPMLCKEPMYETSPFGMACLNEIRQGSKQADQGTLTQLNTASSTTQAQLHAAEGCTMTSEHPCRAHNVPAELHALLPVRRSECKLNEGFQSIKDV